MPRGDQTGPEGRGPMTGRGLGYCAGFNSPGFTKGAPRGGAGFGRGRGARGRGFRNLRRPTLGRGQAPVQVPQRTQPQTQPTQEQELQALEQEKEVMENELDALKNNLEQVRNRIQELESE